MSPLAKYIQQLMESVGDEKFESKEITCLEDDLFDVSRTFSPYKTLLVSNFMRSLIHISSA